MNNIHGNAGKDTGSSPSSSNVDGLLNYTDNGSYEKDDQYRFLVEHIEDIVYSLDRDLNILYLSPQIISLGYSVDQLTSGNWIDIVHPSDRDELIRSHLDVMANKSTPLLVFRVVDSNGNIHWLEEKGKAIIDSSGEFIGLTGIVRDITERKKLEDELQLHIRFEQTIRDISVSFIGVSSDELDAKINDAMEAIGKVSGISQCHIFKYSPSMSVLPLLYKWDRFTKDPRNIGDIPVSKVPSLINNLLSGNSVVVSSLSDLPLEMSEETELIRYFGINSYVVVPIMFKNELMGFMGFNKLDEEYHWSDFEVDMFSLVGTIIGNALQHERYDRYLHENELYFRSLFEESNDAVLIHTLDGSILNVNKKACEVFGFETSDFHKINVYSLYNEELFDELPAFARRVLSDGSAHSESLMSKADGSVMDVSISSSFIDQDKELIQTIIQDITKNKAVVKALAESLRLIRATMDSMMDAFFILDRDMNVIFVNDRLNEWGQELGVTNDVLGVNYKEAFPFLDESICDEFKQVFKTGKVIESEEMHVINGNTIFTWVQKIPVLFNNEVQQVATIVHDITEKKKTDRELESYRLDLENKVLERTEELSKLNEQLEEEIFERNIAEALIRGNEILLGNILESSVDGIAFFDIDKNIRIMNSKFIEMWHLPETISSSMEHFDIFVKFGLPQLINSESILEKASKFSDLKENDTGALYFKDGSIVEYNLFPVFGDGTILGHVFNCHDITKSKEAESELIKYSEQLEKSNELKDLFADILRHDLLNPAGIVKGFLSVLIQKETDPFMLDALKKIELSNQKLIDMIEMASKLSRLESVEDIEFSEIDIGLMLNDARTNLGALFSSKCMNVVCRFDGAYTAKANIMIEDVFVNLLSNAVKYSPPKSTIYIDIFDVGDMWKVEITDFGEGISDEDKPHVFERFKRVNKSSTKGHGIGLAIVKKIVDLHGGNVGVRDNSSGVGCVFWATVKKA